MEKNFFGKGICRALLFGCVVFFLGIPGYTRAQPKMPADYYFYTQVMHQWNRYKREEERDRGLQFHFTILHAYVDGKEGHTAGTYWYAEKEDSLKALHSTVFKFKEVYKLKGDDVTWKRKDIEEDIYVHGVKADSVDMDQFYGKDFIREVPWYKRVWYAVVGAIF